MHRAMRARKKRAALGSRVDSAASCPVRHEGPGAGRPTPVRVRRVVTRDSARGGAWSDQRLSALRGSRTGTVIRSVFRSDTDTGIVMVRTPCSYSAVASSSFAPAGSGVKWP